MASLSHSKFWAIEMCICKETSKKQQGERTSLSSYYVSVTVVSTLNVSYVIEGASQMVQW